MGLPGLSILVNNPSNALALVPQASENHQKTREQQEQLAKMSLNDLDAEEVGKVVNQLQDEIKIIKL